MPKPKAGLLPLYLQLYDDAITEARPRIEEFYQTIASELAMRGVEVAITDICRIKNEFGDSVDFFEEAEVDAIITLHLAYSPSLESIAALSHTDLPIIVLDTTPTFNYSSGQDPAELIYNHGIHGVQDMCNLLIRYGKPFEIEAGHWQESDVLDRVAAWIRAASIASNMKTARVGQIGGSFVGMGDFAVPADVLRSTIGVETVVGDFAVIKSLMPAEDDPQMHAEIAADMAKFTLRGISEEAHLYSTGICLAIRKWMENEGLSAFTMNFGAIDASSGFPTVPFLEASKAMARGKGYAGEGDILTAALVGALVSVYPETTFTEIFCPDWENDTLFLSHMGEFNLELAENVVLKTMEMPLLSVASPVVAVGRFRGGAAVFVDLAPGLDNSYTLIVAPVEVLGKDGEDKMSDSIRGWIKPTIPIADFLEDYSKLGGTHHAAMVYGDVIDDMIRFGRIMGWNVAVLGQ